jgi:hypothetical protein
MTTSVADQLWGLECLAYNVHAGLDQEGTRFLAGLASQLDRCGQPLLTPPAHALHSTIAYFLSARARYDRPKQDLWAEHGARWRQRLSILAEHTAPFDMTFERIAVSERAVIALAQPVAQVDAIRAAVARCQGEAAIPGRQPDILYVTLARYGPEPVNLEVLRAHASVIDAAGTVRVRGLLLSEEHVYPNLQGRTVAELALGG